MGNIICIIICAMAFIVFGVIPVVGISLPPLLRRLYISKGNRDKNVPKPFENVSEGDVIYVFHSKELKKWLKNLSKKNLNTNPNKIFKKLFRKNLHVYQVDSVVDNGYEGEFAGVEISAEDLSLKIKITMDEVTVGSATTRIITTGGKGKKTFIDETYDHIASPSLKLLNAYVNKMVIDSVNQFLSEVRNKPKLECNIDDAVNWFENLKKTSLSVR